MDPGIRPINIAALRQQYLAAKPFPFIKIDNFLHDDFAAEIVASYPTYEEAKTLGREFSAVNERLKVQITDSGRFPAPVKRLHEALSSPQFLAAVEQITGIEALLADEKLVGGGMHLTGPGGRLDVHVDFNYEEERKLHRRLNILLYLNPEWPDDWGGAIELWDEGVRNRVHAFQPLLNRCVLFETSETSYHGVSPNVCPQGQVRRSFAGYYYTKEPPARWDGIAHSTVFKARPDELIRGAVLMPAEKARRSMQSGINKAKQFVKNIVGTDK
ncbi:MAG: 2OG-Fe(II) oxygenase [Steroidobacteraceae bacterium]